MAKLSRYEKTSREMSKVLASRALKESLKRSGWCEFQCCPGEAWVELMPYEEERDVWTAGSSIRVYDNGRAPELRFDHSSPGLLSLIPFNLEGVRRG